MEPPVDEELPYFDVNTDRAYKIRAATLGIEAQNFLASQAGQAIVNKAEYEESMLLEALIEADPDDVKENRRIRHEIRLREVGLGWLFEVIKSGELAEQEIHDDPHPLPETDLDP